MINPLENKIENYKPYDIPTNNCKYKMDANESPWDLPASLRETLARELLMGNSLNRYPDPNALALKEALARHHGLTSDCLAVGSGSDELIHLIVTAFLTKGDKVVMPTPTFGMYKVCTSLVGGIPLEVPLAEDFAYDFKAFKKVIDQTQPRLLIFCNPNNPTGNTLDLKKLADLSQSFPGPIVVDEAYGEFTHKSALALLPDCPNLLILKTFSKAFGLAGLRIGYSLSSPKLAQAINSVKSPYNLNSFSQKAATLILENMSLIKPRIKKIIKQKEFMYMALSKIPSLQVYPSEANFLLLRVNNGNSIWQRLLEEGIAVRNFGDQPLLQDCLRVSIADSSSNLKFLETLMKILKEEGCESIACSQGRKNNS